MSEDDGMSSLSIKTHHMGSKPSQKDGSQDPDFDVGALESIDCGGRDHAGHSGKTKCHKDALHDMNPMSIIEVEGDGELARPGGRAEKRRGGMRACIGARATLCILFVALGVYAAGSLLGQGHAAGEGEQERRWERDRG